MRRRVALGACLAFAALSGAAIGEDTKDERPRILTKEQYYCLVRHADTLEVSKGGTVVDIRTCPPEVNLNLIAPIVSDNFILLTSEDVKCLERGRKAGHNIAFKRGNKHVALYLRPCGRN